MYLCMYAARGPRYILYIIDEDIDIELWKPEGGLHRGGMIV